MNKSLFNLSFPFFFDYLLSYFFLILRNLFCLEKKVEKKKMDIENLKPNFLDKYFIRSKKNNVSMIVRNHYLVIFKNNP